MNEERLNIANHVLHEMCNLLGTFKAEEDEHTRIASSIAKVRSAQLEGFDHTINSTKVSYLFFNFDLQIESALEKAKTREQKQKEKTFKSKEMEAEGKVTALREYIEEM